MLNRLAQNCYATVQFIDGNKLASTVRHANVARPENNCLRAKRDHAGGLSPEGYCCRNPARGVSEEFNQVRFRRGFKTLIGARGPYFAVKVRVCSFEIRYRFFHQIQNMIGRLPGH